MTCNSWLRLLALGLGLATASSLVACGNGAETGATSEEPACDGPECTDDNECTEPRPDPECSSCNCQDGEWMCLLIDPSCYDAAGRRYTCGETTTTPNGCVCSCTGGSLECENCPTGCQGPAGISTDAATCNTCDCSSGECTSLSCQQGCATAEGSADDPYYIDGDRFLNNDGCLSTCINGQVLVDEHCVPSGSCQLEGYSFLDGESFTHPLNFCDTCTCADGVVECVEMDCFFCRYEGHVYPPGLINGACTCEPGGVECEPPPI